MEQKKTISQTNTEQQYTEITTLSFQHRNFSDWDFNNVKGDFCDSNFSFLILEIEFKFWSKLCVKVQEGGFIKTQIAR